MDCKINSHCTDGINCYVYDSLNCKGCCDGGSSSPPRDRKHAHFYQDIRDGSENYAAENRQFPVGICACCKDPPCQPFPKSCQNFGRPILVYEIPTPKFEGTTTHQRDFGPKPVPVKEMPPWHPILKDRWKSLDVPSFNKSTYQSDFTPQVATQECRKPVYLAPRERKDRCQELAETFKTWRKTSEGPSQTHEVCDKPIIAETTAVCEEPVPSSDNHHHEYPCYVSMKQLHGPDCEKHCFSAPLMCHVRSPKSHSDEHHVAHCHGERRIPDQQVCNNSQFVCSEGDLTKLATTGHHHHTGLLDSEAIEIHPTQNEREYSARINLRDGLSNAEDENKCLNKDLMCHPDVTNRYSCHDYARHSVDPLTTTCITMNHPAGDGCDYFPSNEQQQQHLPAKCSQDISDSRRSKHVHFAQEPEVCCDQVDSRKSEKYHSSHSAHDAHNFVKSSCLSSRSAVNSNAFTLCEDVTNNQPKYWWKKTTCEPQRNNIEVADVPQDVTKPFCPSYLTIHRRDYTEPCLEKQSNGDSRALSKECGCTGNMTEKFLCPEFERGGLI
ncbi:hypothetical protein AVEN_64415-1 [Araneus ventricosus]|uniref:Uncharacterized protein n=1 Tax=Araneus ventricosus TaxID=182803 RepID=A0A4Y2N5S2_ARAVE|nr:hypothetical protein AVEN_64415-1 [Araneus ventricosus]